LVEVRRIVETPREIQGNATADIGAAASRHTHICTKTCAHTHTRA
jgi:hypothetical protein